MKKMTSTIQILVFFYFIVKYDSKIAVYNANGAFGLVFIVKKEKKENNEFAIKIDNE